MDTEYVADELSSEFEKAWFEFAEIADIKRPADNPIAYKAFFFAWSTAAKKCIEVLESVE